ncbi:MAG: FKBP-type peptidyl-prolyl cis-trans isomerase [Ilumatobacteraceae bacterium]
MPKRSVAVVVALVAVVSSCGDGDGGQDDAVDVSLERQSGPPEELATAGSAVDASVPEVVVPASTPTELAVTELRAGSGPESAAGDVVLVNYVGVRSADGTQFDANYGADPLPVILGQGMVIEGWDQGLVGVQAGERLQLDIPAELAYGDEPPGEDIQPGDALSFVIDVVSVSKGSPAPAIEELPVDDEPVTELVVNDARVGEGAELEAGQQAFFDLLLVRGDTGEVLQSSWEPDSPARVEFGAEGTAPFLVEGLAGMRVGGRRVLTVPFDQVFQPAQAEELGIPEGTDLIVVADLITTTPDLTRE